MRLSVITRVKNKNRILQRWIRSLFKNLNNLQINSIGIGAPKIIRIKNGTKIETIDRNNPNKVSRFQVKEERIIGNKKSKRVKLLKTRIMKEGDLDMSRNSK